MKINIPKFQGGSALPLVDYMPYQGAAPVTAPEKGSETSSDAVGLKDVLKLADQLDGLHNDMDATISSIKDLYANSSLFTNGDLSATDLVTTYLSALQKFKVAKLNKEQFNEARELVTKNGGLHEVAIDSSGNLLVQDNETGKMFRLSPEQYKSLNQEHPDQYEALTNEHLLWMRDNEPSLAFRNDLLSTVSNGIGYEKVTDFLQKATQGLGTDTLQKEGYSEKTANGILNGMGALITAYEEGMTVEGLYKQNTLTQDQSKQINLALQYLWKTLPENAKTYLKYKSDSTDKGALSLMSDLLFSKNSNTQKFTQELQKNPDGSVATSKGNSGNAELDPVKALVLGMGYQKDFTLNTGTSYEATLRGNYSVLTSANGTPLGEFSSLNAISGGAFAPVLDLNNATIGGARIETLNKAFVNNADIVGVDLPIDVYYLQQTGITRPDINLLGKIEDLHTAMQQGIVDSTNVEQINAYCDKIGLPPMYASLDENGIPQLNKNYFARFARIDGLVDETALDETTMVDNTVREASDGRRNNFKAYMKTHDKGYSIGEGFLGLGKDNLYEGAIYIPIRSDIIASSLGNSNYYKLPGANDAIQVAQKWADMKAVQNYQAAPTLSQLKN
jgi:hypothetical protein